MGLTLLSLKKVEGPHVPCTVRGGKLKERVTSDLSRQYQLTVVVGSLFKECQTLMMVTLGRLFILVSCGCITVKSSLTITTPYSVTGSVGFFSQDPVTVQYRISSYHVPNCICLSLSGSSEATLKAA